MNTLRVHPPVKGNWVKEAGARYLVALDVDGTLVRHDTTLTAAVQAAVQEVVSRGHAVIIATGRSRQAALRVSRQLGIEKGYMVTSNGAVTLELAPRFEQGYRVLDTATFNPQRALSLLQEKIPYAQMALESPSGEIYATADFQDGSFGALTTPSSKETLLEHQSATRVVVFAEDAHPEEFKKSISEAGLHGVNYAVGWTAWLDLAAHGVSKASALEQLRRRLYIDPAHTVAVGDGYNDIEMLSWAARGVAMGEAPDEVIAAADEVTLSVYQDGLVPVLESLI
ncbi:MAG: HAD family hydrolase [Rothia sp. (in: high G+C Gram-positive bacteria)]|nr:HAD family hydrolase [Rothia sp. (in: high G+C Gram-positive bacteria)]